MVLTSLVLKTIIKQSGLKRNYVGLCGLKYKKINSRWKLPVNLNSITEPGSIVTNRYVNLNHITFRFFPVTKNI